jgi:hypothetical protein
MWRLKFDFARTTTNIAETPVPPHSSQLPIGIFTTAFLPVRHEVVLWPWHLGHNFLGIIGLPSLKHVHDITNLPKTLGYIGGHCRCGPKRLMVANKIVVHANSATECVWKVEHDRVVGRILDCRSPALVPLRIFASFWPASLPIAPIVHHRAAEQSHARKEVVDCHLRLTRIGDRPIIDLRGGAALRGQCQGNGIDRLDRLVSLPKIISGPEPAEIKARIHWIMY